jgi:hypothetical protein
MNPFFDEMTKLASDQVGSGLGVTMPLAAAGAAGGAWYAPHLMEKADAHAIAPFFQPQSAWRKNLKIFGLLGTTGADVSGIVDHGEHVSATVRADLAAASRAKAPARSAVGALIGAAIGVGVGTGINAYRRHES